jgi:1,4-dihydroxy-2-naphthoate octaprenyltransferase
LAFLLQVSELHILVFMLALPLTCLYLALQVASSFEYYAYDTKHAAGTLLSIAGWQRGISIHNISIGLAFFLYALFLAFKLPWPLTWPIFLALPLGVLQIVQMTRIGDGARPNWRLFRLNSLATFLLVVYLITFRLWSL